jgi:hypothetical protein
MLMLQYRRVMGVLALIDKMATVGRYAVAAGCL